MSMHKDGCTDNLCKSQAIDNTMSYSTFERGSQVRRKRPEIKRFAFFDLDNTLIPTSWIMQRWRSEESYVPHAKIVKSINDALSDAGLFEALDDLFRTIKKQTDQIVIITNAGSRTVDNFYLTHCLPQLRNLLTKQDIQLTTTEEWVLAMGPPPSPEDENAFREFYTVVKYKEFYSWIDKFLEAQDAVAQPDEPKCLVDVLSVGDQMCEISAACRLSESHGDRIRLLKLVMILDPTNSRFTYQQPAQFVEQLASVKRQALRTLAFNRESLMTTEKVKKSGRGMCGFGGHSEIKEGVAYWVPQPESLTYAIGRPSRFPTEFPFYLPMEYLRLKPEDTHGCLGIHHPFGEEMDSSDMDSTSCVVDAVILPLHYKLQREEDYGDDDDVGDSEEEINRLPTSGSGGSGEDLRKSCSSDIPEEGNLLMIQTTSSGDYAVEEDGV